MFCHTFAAKNIFYLQLFLNFFDIFLCFHLIFMNLLVFKASTKNLEVIMDLILYFRYVMTLIYVKIVPFAVSLTAIFDCDSNTLWNDIIDKLFRSSLRSY